MTWQPAALVFPDVEALLTSALRTAVAAQGEVGVKVDRRIPNPKPTRLIVVNRDGGGEDEFRDVARIRVRVFDDTDAKVTDLAYLVAAIFPLLVRNGVLLKSVRESGPYDVADIGEKPQRYLLFTVHTRPVRQLT